MTLKLSLPSFENRARESLNWSSSHSNREQRNLASEDRMKSNMESPTVSSDFDLKNLVGNTNNKTVPEYILRQVDKHSRDGKNDFIIDVVSGQRHAYSDIRTLTYRIASYFYKRGMRKGDTLIYMPYDMLHIHIIFLGVWTANGIVRASYPEDDEQTLFERVEESRAGWILCEPSTAKMCLSVASQIYWDVDVIVIGREDDEIHGCISIYDLFEDDGSEVPEFKLCANDIALILCTSGTTGKSKGAVHTHRSLLNQILSLRYFMPFPEDKPTLMASKGTHISGTVFPLGGMYAGATCLCMERITKENIFNAVERFKPALIFGFPTFLLQLVNDPEAHKYDFTSLEYASTGGAPITPTIESTLMKLPNMKAILIIYGLTEVCPISSGNQVGSKVPSKCRDMPSFSVGKLSPGVQLQIRHQDTGKILGPYQRGEICIRSPTIFCNYYKNAEATKKAFVKGWFLTGDIGYYDENDYLFLVDRIKEIFKYYNNHISPTELEDVIASHPDVAEVCVVGVPDPEGGDRIPRAFVTVKGTRDHIIGAAEAIRKFANAKLPNYKQLRGGLYILPDLPKGKTGKISRQIMMDLEVP